MAYLYSAPGRTPGTKHSQTPEEVTGSGSRRVGRGVAEALAARGYALAVHYRTAAVEATAAVDAFHARGVEAVALQADLTDERSVRALIDQTLSRFGRLDALVTCA